MRIFKPHTFGAFLAFAMVPAAMAEPIVAGLSSSKLKPELKGMVMVEELNCVACHQSDAGFADQSKKAPKLSGVGSRINPNYLEKFIQDPHNTKPGTTMPDVLAGKDQKEKSEIAQSITHFLLSLGENDFAPQLPDRVAANEGERLFHMRGCIACHSPRDANGMELMKDTSVPLGELHKKYSGKSLAKFLMNPHSVRPSGRMPNLELPAKEVEAITNYLLRDTQMPGHLNYTLYQGSIWEGIGTDGVKAIRAGHVDDFALKNLGKIRRQYAVEYDGWLDIPKAGSYTFHLTLNGGSLAINGKQLLSLEPSQLRAPTELKTTLDLKKGWQKINVSYYHTGDDKKFSLELEGAGRKRSAIASAMLSVSKQPIPEFVAPKVDAVLAKRGRAHFANLGCASCHTDLEIQPIYSTPFAKLSAGKGCVSDSVGKHPHYGLGTKQRELINQFLPLAQNRKLSDREKINKSLTTFNCIACHDRDGLGGIDTKRNPYFTGTHPELGEQGRLPPSLSHVGAKITPEWMREVMLNGKTQRDYIHTKMPQYGAENVEHLIELFGKVDTLENVTFPKISNIQESKNVGYNMIGTKGFSCVACHDFNGKNPLGAGALDLVHVTDRVQKNWFHIFMRNPSRFHTTGIMPSFWPGGKSIRPDVLEGDANQQIEALWKYLEDGPRAKKPEGLSRQSDQLRVFDKAEMVRGRGTEAGFRAIGVGYPERLNLAFDSEEMALRLLWKGTFANVNHGSFKVSGKQQITFPKGIPFHRLKSLDAHWPYKAKTNYLFPQDHGYQYRGYRLDNLRRPTFQYEYGGIQVEDFFETVEEEKGKARFKRTVNFESSDDQEPFYFRILAGKGITVQSDSDFRLGELKVRITSGQKAIVRKGDAGDVLIPVKVPKGKLTLTLEYQW